MSKARQSRQLAATWARTLGGRAGVGAVDDFASGGPCGDHEPDAHELLATIARGSLGWDEAAIQAGCAEIDRCPKGFEQAYYEAYELAARARVVELAAERNAARAAA